MQIIKSFGLEASGGWIEYDPDLWVGDYNIVRQMEHDGTGIFTRQLYGEVLFPILNRVSYGKNEVKDPESIKSIRYTIGPMRIATVFGRIEINGLSMFGEKQRIRMAVKCEYEFK